MSNGAQERGDSAAERPVSGQQPTGGTQASSGSQSQQAAKSPEELQRDIEHTREELGDTVDALS